MNYENKYLKYKIKYLELSNQLSNNKQIGGSKSLLNIVILHHPIIKTIAIK